DAVDFGAGTVGRPGDGGDLPEVGLCERDVLDGAEELAGGEDAHGGEGGAEPAVVPVMHGDAVGAGLGRGVNHGFVAAGGRVFEEAGVVGVAREGAPVGGVVVPEAVVGEVEPGLEEAVVVAVVAADRQGVGVVKVDVGADVVADVRVVGARPAELDVDPFVIGDVHRADRGLAGAHAVGVGDREVDVVGAGDRGRQDRRGDVG